jgi:hypothetical protein
MHACNTRAFTAALPQVRAQELSYNGRPFHDFVVERSAAYVSQNGAASSGEGRSA